MFGAPPHPAVEPGYEIEIVREGNDPAWDAFVAETPGGHHTQSSLWAEFKSSAGWDSARIVAKNGEQIVGGAQLLARPLRLTGKVGYVRNGPVFAAGSEPKLMRAVLGEMLQVVDNLNLNYLYVLPPVEEEQLAGHLTESGLKPSMIPANPAATVLLDLNKSRDELLAGMRKKTRQYVRRSERQGIEVREGAEEDLPILARLLENVGARRGFSPLSEAYFRRLWSLYAPLGWLKLFVAEYEGEPVSALLIVTFGDTVRTKTVGWSGQHGDRRPNEAVYWAAIQWAQENGFRFCDLEGIDTRAAEALAQGQPIPDDLKRSPSFFKLGLGGKVFFYPPAYDATYNPVYALGYKMVFPAFADFPPVRRILGRIG